MDNAVNAVNSLFKGSTSTQSESEKAPSSTASTSNTSTQNAEQTVDSTVAPSVEHTHIKKTHETKEQKFVEKEKHQDHYHTTVQPLKDSEVLPEKHDHTQETKRRTINKDEGTAETKAQADRSGFESTSEQKEFESKTTEPTKQTEHVDHHLHETVQPVIEREVIDPSVTHKRVDVQERIQEPSKNHGVTTNSTVSVEEFENKLGDKK